MSIERSPQELAVPLISAIVVTHNNQRDIAACLRSLETSRQPIAEIIVIDLRSTDDTVDLVRRDFPGVRMLGFRDNPGFGEGNNRGARVATGDFLLLLNPDAQLDPDCAGALLAELEANSRSAIAVPKTLLAFEPSLINSAGLQINRVGHAWDRGYLEWDRGQYDRGGEVFAGSGCALLIRAARFHALGGFDPRYFLYYEDLDLCWRAWNAGEAVTYVPAGIVRHAATLSGRSPWRDHYLDQRNRLRTILKNASTRSLLRNAVHLLAFEAGIFVRLGPKPIWFRLCALAWNAIHLRDTLAIRRRVRRSTAGDDAFERMQIRGSRPLLNAPRPTYREAYEHALPRHELASGVAMGVNEVGSLGLGWHDLQVIGGRTARWCGAYGIIFLAAPAANEEITVEITCWADHPREVTVRTNREVRSIFSVSPGRWQTIGLKATSNGGYYVRIDLLVQSASGMTEHDSTMDERRVGIAVAAIRSITPVPQSQASESI